MIAAIRPACPPMAAILLAVRSAPQRLAFARHRLDDVYGILRFFAFACCLRTYSVAASRTIQPTDRRSRSAIRTSSACKSLGTRTPTKVEIRVLAIQGLQRKICLTRL